MNFFFSNKTIPCIHDLSSVIVARIPELHLKQTKSHNRYRKAQKRRQPNTREKGVVLTIHVPVLYPLKFTDVILYYVIAIR